MNKRLILIVLLLSLVAMAFATEGDDQSKEENKEENKEETKTDTSADTAADSDKPLENLPYMALPGSKEPFFYKNGYDPLMNDMLKTSMNGYLAAMHQKLQAADLSLTKGLTDQAVPVDYHRGQYKADKVIVPTPPATPEAPASEVPPATENPETANDDPNANPETALDDPNAANPETANPDTNQDTDNDNPGGAAGGDADDAGAGEGNEETEAPQSAQAPAATTDISYRNAPFRVVNDVVNADLKSMTTQLTDLNALLQKAALKPKPFAATNKEDEDVIRSITNSKVAADQKVVEKIHKNKLAAVKTGDPFEINVLHGISTKLRKVQDAVVRTATHQQQPLPAQTVMLQNLVKNVKAMRKQAEEKYQVQPLRTYAKDEKRLLKMEKLLSKMTELMNDRSLSPKEFNYLAAQYRDRLAKLRGRE